MTTTTTPTKAQAITVTLAQMAQAFEAWENGFRADPTAFLSADEASALGVSELSADRAAYFHELLTKSA